MEQYIPKSALVAEIERMEKSIGSDRFLSEFETGYNQGKEDVCDDLRAFIDTLEVKEVDLKKEIGEYLSTYWPEEKELHPFLGHIAKHFFELGLKAARKGE